jgi:hypothetical protein
MENKKESLSMGVIDKTSLINDEKEKEIETDVEQAITNNIEKYGIVKDEPELLQEQEEKKDEKQEKEESVDDIENTEKTIESLKKQVEDFRKIIAKSKKGVKDIKEYEYINIMKLEDDNNRLQQNVFDGIATDDEKRQLELNKKRYKALLNQTDIKGNYIYDSRSRASATYNADYNEQTQAGVNSLRNTFLNDITNDNSLTKAKIGEWLDGNENEVIKKYGINKKVYDNIRAVAEQMNNKLLIKEYKDSVEKERDLIHMSNDIKNDMFIKTLNMEKGIIKNEEFDNIETLYNAMNDLENDYKSGQISCLKNFTK